MTYFKAQFQCSQSEINLFLSCPIRFLCSAEQQICLLFLVSSCFFFQNQSLCSYKIVLIGKQFTSWVITFVSCSNVILTKLANCSKGKLFDILCCCIFREKKKVLTVFSLLSQYYRSSEFPNILWYTKIHKIGLRCNPFGLIPGNKLCKKIVLG